jgi:hypothetical protein
MLLRTLLVIGFVALLGTPFASAHCNCPSEPNDCDPGSDTLCQAYLRHLYNDLGDDAFDVIEASRCRVIELLGGTC